MSNKQVFAIILIASGIISYSWPGFNGLFSDAANITTGEGRIIAAIYITGGLLLWFLPSKDK